VPKNAALVRDNGACGALRNTKLKPPVALILLSAFSKLE
jgi:hypothetical protein